MDATIKIRRSPDGSSHSLETYTVEVAETATLLDVLDAVKDSKDGSLAYRKSCRITVTNEGKRLVPMFYYHVDYRNYASLPEDVGYFHAYYRQERPARDAILDDVRE